jgi:hypothetical protein
MNMSSRSNILQLLKAYGPEGLDSLAARAEFGISGMVDSTTARRMIEEQVAAMGIDINAFAKPAAKSESSLPEWDNEPGR